MNANTPKDVLDQTRRELARIPLDDRTKKAVNDSLKRVEANVGVPNTPVYRLAVGAVALIGFTIVAGSILITLLGMSEQMPDFFAVALGAAIGALAGMLVPSGR